MALGSISDRGRGSLGHFTVEVRHCLREVHLVGLHLACVSRNSRCCLANGSLVGMHVPIEQACEAALQCSPACEFLRGWHLQERLGIGKDACRMAPTRPDRVMVDMQMDYSNIAVALLATVAGLRTFSVGRLVFYREAASGLNR